jgi:hypothetical protein
MKYFTTTHKFLNVYQWLAANATGECSVIVDSPRLGPMVYVYRPYVKPLWHRLYGPVASMEDYA